VSGARNDPDVQGTYIKRGRQWVNTQGGWAKIVGKGKGKYCIQIDGNDSFCSTDFTRWKVADFGTKPVPRVTASRCPRSMYADEIVTVQEKVFYTAFTPAQVAIQQKQQSQAQGHEDGAEVFIGEQTASQLKQMEGQGSSVLLQSTEDEEHTFVTSGGKFVHYSFSEPVAQAVVLVALGTLVVVYLTYRLYKLCATDESDDKFEMAATESRPLTKVESVMAVGANGVCTHNETTYNAIDN